MSCTVSKLAIQSHPLLDPPEYCFQSLEIYKLGHDPWLPWKKWFLTSIPRAKIMTQYRLTNGWQLVEDLHGILEVIGWLSSKFRAANLEREFGGKNTMNITRESNWMFNKNKDIKIFFTKYVLWKTHTVHAKFGKRIWGKNTMNITRESNSMFNKNKDIRNLLFLRDKDTPWYDIFCHHTEWLQVLTQRAAILQMY